MRKRCGVRVAGFWAALITAAALAVPAQAQEPGSPVEVTFRFDRSGMIHVQAREQTSQVGAETSFQRESGFDRVTLDELTSVVSQLTVE